MRELNPLWVRLLRTALWMLCAVGLAYVGIGIAEYILNPAAFGSVE